MPTGAAGQLEFKHSPHTGLIIENPKEETTPADVRGLASEALPLGAGEPRLLARSSGVCCTLTVITSTNF